MKITEIKWEDGKQYRVNIKTNRLKEGLFTVRGEELISNNYFLSIGEYVTMQEIVEANFEEVIDWASVAVDTKIRVGVGGGGALQNRYFAGYKDGVVIAWHKGKTSFSADDEHDTATWVYAELAE
jgi:hypothetical protein